MNFRWNYGRTPLFFGGYGGADNAEGVGIVPIEGTIFYNAQKQGDETLSETDIKNIKKLLPDFSFKILTKWRSLGNILPRINDILFPTIEKYFPF